MKILITGVNGYIGKSLFNALKDKYEVTGISRNNFDLADSIATGEFFKSRHPFDVVIHCAAAGATNPRSNNWDILDNNLKMYYNLIQHKNYFTKFINLGSGAENYMFDTPYGLSKKVITNSILDKDNYFNIKIFGLFDENELNTRFIKANIRKYISNSPMLIHQDKHMDFFYMSDLVKIIEYYIISSNPIPTFSCTYGKYYLLSEIANMINNLDDHKVDITITNKELAESYTSSQWFELGLDFIGLEEGIKQVYSKLKNED